VEYQLRIYTIREGEMDAWVREWRDHIEPLRKRFGFDVIGPWVITDENRFCWILGYSGADGWHAANEAYYASADRSAVDPDPARHIARGDRWMMRSV
jgi:hypothetical protein